MVSAKPEETNLGKKMERSEGRREERGRREKRREVKGRESKQSEVKMFNGKGRRREWKGGKESGEARER